MKDELELKDIAGYLPYGLKWSLQELYTFTMIGLTQRTLYTEEGNVLTWPKQEDLPQALFPLLRPLSDLFNNTDFIIFMMNVEIGNVFLDVKTNILYLQGTAIAIDNKITPSCPYVIYNYLVSHHYDVNNLIGRKLAIEK